MTEESGHITALSQTTVHVEGWNTGNFRTMQRRRRVVCWIGRTENPLDNLTGHKTASATLQKMEVNQRQVVWPKRPSNCDEEGSPNNKAMKSTSSSKRDPGDHRKKKNNCLHKLGGNGHECAGATTRREFMSDVSTSTMRRTAANESRLTKTFSRLSLKEGRDQVIVLLRRKTLYKAPSETTDEYDVLRRSADVGMSRHPTDTFLDTQAAWSHNTLKKGVLGSGRVLSLRQKYPATSLKSPGDHDLHLVTAIWHWEKKR
ncbi:hypothetical protein B0H16DRAFT_1827525 [Mycena metata]|uniref:Uncharacterized protein n=1 Tax=Mycena metata TaxID=1033252 RepID=A0AAD7GTR3_9AGAR|nr:hypothetical protein B0H16DRAFT_1827525 [Mycena metata]